MELLDRYLDYVSEVENRIITHAGELGMRFFNGRAPQKVLACDTGLADRHSGGRMTLIVTTDAGKLLYKPHSLRTDVTARRLFLEFFSDVVAVPDAIDCGDYGFCRFVENAPADTREGAEGYFRNLGGVAAIARALGMGDLLMENFLAEGSIPVLVDPELLLTPGGPAIHRGGTDESAFERRCREPFDDSALFSTLGNVPTGLLNCPNAENRGLPVVGGVRQLPFDHQKEILAGYNEVYGRCLLHRNAIRSRLEELRDAPVRVIVRGTNYYSDMIAIVKNPAISGSAEKLRRIFARMSKPFDDRRITGYEQLLDAEQRAILAEDVPLFHTTPGSRDLFFGDGIVFEGYCACSMLENLDERLGRLCEADRRFTASLIERKLAYSACETEYAAAALKREAEPIGRDSAVRAAEGIFTRLCGELAVTPEGDCGFLSWGYNNAAVDPCGPELGMGAMGPAVFSAAVAKTIPGSAREAERIIASACDAAEARIAAMETCALPKNRLSEVGLLSGAAGILEGMTLITDVCACGRAEKLRGRALALADRLDIGAVRDPGVYNGLAGLLLAVCDRRNPSCDAALVRRIADRLAWIMESGAKELLSGFGHGLAGIGTAFLAAFERTGETAYRRAAAEAFSREHSLYREDLGTWPDLRKGSGGNARMNGICSGAPGIAIAMAAAEGFGVEHAAEDGRRALAAMLDLPLSAVDYLCCGNAALAESLLFRGERGLAAGILGAVAERMERTGGPVVSRPGYRRVFCPGLFFGWSGIGYEFLKFAFPEELPSLLSFGFDGRRSSGCPGWENGTL